VRYAAANRARLDVHRGDLDAGARWAADAGLLPDGDPAHPREYEHLTLARILIARGEPARALPLLERLRAAATTAGRATSEIETLILESLARQRYGDDVGALAALEAALVIAEPEGYVRLFVDEGPPLAVLLARRRVEHRAARPNSRRAYVDRLLAAFGSSRRDLAPSAPAGRSAAGRAPALPEPLTPREREVLVLIADGLTNSEIAARLFVTVGTVKTYVNGIFGKLGARSRTQAVARARTVGLLGDRGASLR
jgi:LuxR family maltose regulon positive regulatory protein